MLRDLDKLGSADERLYYLRAGVEHGWSRNVLALQIENRLHLRQGQAVTNFLSAVDDLMRHPDDQPSIGILLCRAREDPHDDDQS